jgi:ribonuclease HII
VDGEIRFVVHCSFPLLHLRVPEISMRDKRVQNWGRLPLTMRPETDPAAGFFPYRRTSLAAGIDEAGRGGLAGPVVAAAVILPETFHLPGLADSKVVAPSRRNGLAAAIGQISLAWGLGVVWPAEIDQTDILRATLKAMSRAAAVLKVRPEILLIDGDKRIPEPLLRQAGFAAMPAQREIIDGDATVPVIAAASILAKTFRDQLMEKLNLRYPGYGFAAHKGYGTAEHREALGRLGPCRMHRLTFRGVLPEHMRQPAQEQGRLC